MTPAPGDPLSVSVHYDRQGHDYFTATDLTQAATQTVQVDAVLAGTAYTTAVIGGEISNSAVTRRRPTLSRGTSPAATSPPTAAAKAPS